MLSGVVAWPAEFGERYRARGYWAGETIGDAFDRSVRQNAGRLAVVDGPRRITYEALGELVDRMTAALALIPSELRGFDYVAMAEELRGSLPALREVFVVGDRAGGKMTRVGDVLERPAVERPSQRFRPRAEDVAVFQLSGGTTGLPKVIPRTHDDYLFNTRHFAATTSFDRDAVLLVSIPVAHNFPLACPGIQGALLLGARVVLTPSPEPETVFSLIEGEGVTWIPAVPASVITWLAHPRRARYDLASIRTLAVGGSRLNPEPARAVLDALGPVLTQVYGMAEGLLCCTRHDDPIEVIVETQGRPMSPDDEIRIVDDGGNAVPDGEMGELECRGPYTIRGYYRADDHNKTAFTADGFYRTGDLVRRHPSGNLVVEGRHKDTINRGGEKISSEEVENLIPRASGRPERRRCSDAGPGARRTHVRLRDPAARRHVDAR